MDGRASAHGGGICQRGRNGRGDPALDPERKEEKHQHPESHADRKIVRRQPAAADGYARMNAFTESLPLRQLRLLHRRQKSVILCAEGNL